MHTVMLKMTLEFTESNRYQKEFAMIARVFMKTAELQHVSLQCDINLPMFHRKLLRPPLQQTTYPGAADSRYILQDGIFLHGCLRHAPPDRSTHYFVLFATRGVPCCVWETMTGPSYVICVCWLRFQ